MALPHARPDKFHLIAAAVLLLSAWTVSASAASGYQALCPDTESATLEIRDTELDAITADGLPASAVGDDTSDAVAASQLLQSGPEAALSEAFTDSDAATVSGVDEAVSPQAGDDTVSINTRVPGVADDELTRYKRQMFRRDI